MSSSNSKTMKFSLRVSSSDPSLLLHTDVPDDVEQQRSAFTDKSISAVTIYLPTVLVTVLMNFLLALSTISTVSVKAHATTSSSAPSDEECFKLLRSKDSTLWSVSDSNVPWFETLFPSEPLPALTDSRLPKDVFNRLFKDLAQKTKTHLKEIFSFSHLPKSLSAHIQKVILSAVEKSTASTVPKRIVKKAAQLSAASKTHAPAAKTSKSAAAPSSRVPAPKNTAKAPSAKATAPVKKSKITKSKTQTPAVPVTPSRVISSDKVTSVSDVMKCLAEAAGSSRLFFSASETPTFRQLFPGTTMPKFSHRSGNIVVDKVEFAPLLKMRVTLAHKLLRAKQLNVSRLPARFMKYQTRLICRSIEKQLAEKKAAKSAKKQTKAAKAKKVVEFVPSSSALPALTKPSAGPEPAKDETDLVYDLRELRGLLQARITELETSGILPDPRVVNKLASHPLLYSFVAQASVPLGRTPSALRPGEDVITPSYKNEMTSDRFLLRDHTIQRTTSWKYWFRSSVRSAEDFVSSESATVTVTLKDLLAVVSSRTSLHYESMFA